MVFEIGISGNIRCYLHIPYDLPPEAPSFITRVCGSGFHIPWFQFRQARRMSGEAEVLLRAFANALERKQAPGEELCEYTAFASKSAEQAARIAGVMAVYAGEREISAKTISNGITLADWYLAAAVRLRDGATISAEIRKADKLRLWLIERWSEDYIAPSLIVQAGAANIKTAKEARTLISHLVANGWLITMKDGAEVRGIHRKEAWRIVRRVS